MVNENGDNWDERIPGVLFAYHTLVHSSIKMTPFELIYGWKAKLPIDIKPNMSTKVPEDGEINSDTVEVTKDIHQTIREKVAGNITKAKHVQNEQYDCRHNSSHVLSIGARVYLKNN